MANVKGALCALGVALGWAFALASVAFFLFYWRVANETGARSAQDWLLAAIFLLSTGVAAFVGGHIYLIKNKSRWLIVAWIGNAIACALAALLFPFVLMMMV